MEKTTYEVLSKMKKIRDRIYNGELDTLQKINEACRKESGELELWEIEWLHGEMLQSYIILCAVTNKVPVSGY